MSARVVRSERGLLALAFRQDAAVLRSVDQAMARITAGAVASAA